MSEVKIPNSKYANKAPSMEPSCMKCGHIAVCAVFRAIGPLMGNWGDIEKVPEEQKIVDPASATKPFKAEEIAKICKLYADNFVVIRNSEDDEEDY